MTKIKTYKLTFWLPLTVSCLAVFLLLFQSIVNYRENIKQTYTHNENSLKETAWRMSRTLEYNLANNAIDEAKREISMFNLNDQAVFAVLVSSDYTIKLASSFAWQGKNIKAILPDVYDTLDDHVTNKHQKVNHLSNKKITAIVPVVTAPTSLELRSTTQDFLILQIDLTAALNRALSVAFYQSIPTLLMIFLFVLLLIGVIRQFVLTPLQSLDKLAQQFSENKPLTNPLTGDTEQAHVAQALVDAGNRINQQLLDLQDKEQRLSITLDSIGDAVIVTDQHGYIIRLNNVASTMTGWSQQEAIGQALPIVFDIYDASTKEKVINPVEQVLSTKHIVGLANHTVLRSKTGELFHISESAAPIRYSNHESEDIYGVILVFQNVTTQYNLRSELRKNAEFLQHLFDISPSVTYVLDVVLEPQPSFTLSYLNGAVESYTGDNAAAWLNHPDKWMQRVHPDDMHDVQKAIIEAITTNKHIRHEFRIQHHNGTYITIRNVLTATHNNLGHAQQVVGVALDITDEKHHIEQQQFLGELLDRSLNEIIIFDAETFTITQANKGAQKNLGYSLDELKQLTTIDIKPEFTQSEFEHFVAPLKSGEKDRLEFETLHKRKDGTTYPVTIDIQYDHFSEHAVFVCIIDDITERKHAEQELQISGQVFESTKEGIFVTDSSNTIIQVNPALTTITGYAPEEIIGKNPRIFSSGLQNAEFYADLWDALPTKGAWSGELYNRRKSGEIYPQWLSISAIKDNAGTIQRYIAIMADISAEKKAQERIEFLAQHDALTKLPNRALLNDRIHQAIITAERQHHSTALLFLDLDRFKFVNDSLGHTIGDKLLIEVATLLINNVRKEDTVSRTGGDEFTILLTNTTAKGAAYVAQNLIDAISHPFTIDNHQLFVTLSIGISLYPDNGETEQILSQKADTAMYRAKQNGRNQYQFFTDEMHSQMLIRIELEKELRFAEERGQFELVYQPQLDFETNKIIGCEALIRWNHPNKGYIPPAQFIPIAEESGLINSVGDWVLNTALQQIKQWNDTGYHDLLVAVNLSGIQFNDVTLVERVQTLLHNYQVSAHNLELEITESIAMKDIKLTISQLQNLADLGVKLSLDDFGTGYSSLSYLKKFPINKLKIDQSFVFTMLEDKDNEAIVDAVITLAKSLRLETIAEGVETKAQFDSLKNKGCNQMQGYYFSKPISSEQFILLLASQEQDNVRI